MEASLPSMHRASSCEHVVPCEAAKSEKMGLGAWFQQSNKHLMFLQLHMKLIDSLSPLEAKFQVERRFVADSSQDRS